MRENYKTRIIAWACISRLIVIAVQFVANILIPDHDANVFVYPKNNESETVLDKIVSIVLGGFVRWDAQYFMFIAKHGYAYENTLAFFPLYPIIAKTVTTVLMLFVPFLTEDSVLLIVFTALNFYIFVKASLSLFELSARVLNQSLAFKSTLLFCFNPASIFFSAPYTECLFSYLTFKAMLMLMLMRDEKGKFKSVIGAIIPIALSTSVRSNGILNIGFIDYFLIYVYASKMKKGSVKEFIINLCKLTVILLVISLVCLIPFALVQIYDYRQFCSNFPTKLPDFVISFANANNFILPGQFARYNQSWCFKKVPMAYSYIQDRYWNVGFLKYFKFKQLPNFLLAFPIIYIILWNSCKFAMHHKNYCMNLGVFEFRIFKKSKRKSDFSPEMFVFIVHAVFLTLFCFMCIHVQVTTRMLCSASPVLYWFCSYYFEKIKDEDISVNKVFGLLKKGDLHQKFILVYFLVYSILGTVLFSNFLPWT